MATLTATRQPEATLGAGSTARAFNSGSTPLTFWVGTLDMDDDYPTNGYSLDFTVSGLDAFREVLQVWVHPTAGFVFEYDYANKKLKAYIGDYNNAADGPMIEAASSADLSAITAARCFAIGIR